MSAAAADSLAASRSRRPKRVRVFFVDADATESESFGVGARGLVLPVRVADLRAAARAAPAGVRPALQRPGRALRPGRGAHAIVFVQGGRVRLPAVVGERGLRDAHASGPHGGHQRRQRQMTPLSLLLTHHLSVSFPPLSWRRFAPSGWEFGRETHDEQGEQQPAFNTIVIIFIN